jgi:hypothetical protein
MHLVGLSIEYIHYQDVGTMNIKYNHLTSKYCTPFLRPQIKHSSGVLPQVTYPNASRLHTSLHATVAVADNVLRVALAGKDWFHGHQSLGDITLPSFLLPTCELYLTVHAKVPCYSPVKELYD